MRTLGSSRTIAVCVLSLAAAAAMSSHSSANPMTYNPETDPTPGYNLISWYNLGDADPDMNGLGAGQEAWINSINELYAAGYREVSVSPVRFMENSTGAITADPVKSVPLSHIAAGIDRAKALGMRVTVNPFFEPKNGDTLFSGFRGAFNPDPASAVGIQFWSDYQNYMVEVAQLAQAHGADAMNVGTEYNGLADNAGNLANWNNVINAVDANFSGKMGYASNWDQYNNANAKANIWDHPAIDYLGIDSYFNNIVAGYQALLGANNTQRNTATDNNIGFVNQVPGQTFVEMMTAAWNLKLDGEILPYAAGVQGGAGLPVIFTEIGYLPHNRTSRSPQGTAQPIDIQEQLFSFQGLIRALEGRKDVFNALHIWQWGAPGADGSEWNMGLHDPAIYYENGNNLLTAQWLSQYVSNPVPEPAACTTALVAMTCLAAVRRRRA